MVPALSFAPQDKVSFDSIQGTFIDIDPVNDTRDIIKITERTEQAPQESTEFKINSFDLNDLYKIETITTYNGKTLSESFSLADREVFESAKRSGIDLQYDNSRSNGINILKYGKVL